MKRYHVISISVLIGLIVGLSVSKAAEAAEINKTAYACSVKIGGFQYGETMIVSVNPDSHLATLQRPGYMKFHAPKVAPGVWKTIPNELGDGDPSEVLTHVSKGVFTLSTDGVITETCYLK
ncbi:hypothetical protein RYT91_004437 [Salmonella enterica]|nr:hypothetical protein [Salmonella enterica]ELM2684157.1 hypothetical protein [Salmonella enterica]